MARHLRPTSRRVDGELAVGQQDAHTHAVTDHPSSTTQPRVMVSRNSLLHLQRAAGNQAVVNLLARTDSSPQRPPVPVQSLLAGPEFATVQRRDECECSTSRVRPAPESTELQRQGDADERQDQPDCLLSERVPSTEWALNADVSGQLGAGLGIGTLGLALLNKATGTVHPLVFVGIGLAGGGKGNKKIPRVSQLPTIGNPSPTDFTTNNPVRVPDFNGFGEIATAGGGVLLGFALTFANLPVSTSPAIINLSGIQLGVGASGAVLAGSYHGVSGFCKPLAETAQGPASSDDSQQQGGQSVTGSAEQSNDLSTNA